MGRCRVQLTFLSSTITVEWIVVRKDRIDIYDGRAATYYENRKSKGSIDQLAQLSRRAQSTDKSSQKFATTTIFFRELTKGADFHGEAWNLNALAPEN